MMAMNPAAAYGQSFPSYNSSLQQQQQQQQHQQHGYPPQAPTASSPMQNTLHQHQQQLPGGFATNALPPFAQSMSPTSAMMPMPMPMAGSPSHRVAQGSPQQSPMAAPPARLTQSPPSSPSTSQEKERIALLLELNVELLQEMNKLQAMGKGGALSPEAAAHLKSKGLPDTLASDDYTQVYLRLHSNLGYVCGQTDHLTKPGSKPPHPPSYVTCPPSMPQLEEKFNRLRALFPGWTGKDGQRRSMSNGTNNAPTPFQG